MKREKVETSIDAYKSLDISQLNEIYRQIIQSLGIIGEGSFEDIASHIHVEKSRVWRRMNELEKMGVVYRPGNKRVLKSGRQGYTWMLTNGATPKTVNAEKALKGDSIADISRNMAKISNNVPVQADMFQNI